MRAPDIYVHGAHATYFERGQGTWDAQTTGLYFLLCAAFVPLSIRFSVNHQVVVARPDLQTVTHFFLIYCGSLKASDMGTSAVSPRSLKHPAGPVPK